MNPQPNTKNATVQFRLSTARTVHLHDPAQAKQIVNTLRLIGCEVSVKPHGNHTDTTFRCPDWVTIEVPSDAIAHGWQTWLDESGLKQSTNTSRHRH